MDCPSCHAPNPEASRFCNRCGTVLATATAPAASPPGSVPRYTAPPPQYTPPAPQYAAPPQYVTPPQPDTPPPQQHAAPPPYTPPQQRPAPPHYASPPAAQPPGAPAFAYAGPGVAAAAMPTAADAAGLIQRLLNITLKPKSEWPVIAAEPPSMARVVVGCVLPLAAIQSLLSFVHMAVIGVSVPFAGSVRMPMASSLTAALMGFVFAFIGLFLFALIINAWAPFFGGRRSLGEALKVAAYAGVPAWLGSFFGILGALGTLLGLLAGLYAIYVLCLGLPVVMRSARERAVGYTVAVILTGMLCGLVLGALGVAFGGMSRFGMMRPSAAAQADQGAAITGSILGNMLGTDDKGKAALGQAIGNLARAGEQVERANPAPAPTPAEAAAQAQQSAQQAGNVIGGILGTDAQGRSALGAALGNLASAGQQAQGQNGAQPGNPNVASAQGVASADAAANTGAAVGGLLNALGGALGGSKRFTPVDFRSLGELLPASLNGLPRGATEGANKQAMGVHGSSASARYGGNGTGSIKVEIADVSGVSGLLGLAENLEQTTDAQTADGFERDIVLGGRRVHEKFSNSSKHGDLSVIVGKRFTVDLEGNGIDIAALEQALGQVDLARLESMRNANPQN